MTFNRVKLRDEVTLRANQVGDSVDAGVAADGVAADIPTNGTNSTYARGSLR
jgi:hypothetical protein